MTNGRDGKVRPLVNALAIYAEEGRVYEHDNDDEPSNRRYQSLVSEWSNPVTSNRDDPAFGGEGTWGTETSKYPQEKKSYEIPSVAASERGTV